MAVILRIHKYELILKTTLENFLEYV